MLDIFEAMTTEERRVLYMVAAASIVVGVGCGLWFYSGWIQLQRVATHLSVIAMLGLAIWYFVVADPGGGKLSTLFHTNGTPASNTPPQTQKQTQLPPPPPISPPATPTTKPPQGAWWE